jgi:transcriptional regulator with XRE-family HTH domain
MRSDLKQTRESLGLTQMDVAVKADVSIGTVSGLESGRIKYVSMRVARKLANAYGVTAEQVNGTVPIESATSSAA